METLLNNIIDCIEIRRITYTSRILLYSQIPLIGDDKFSSWVIYIHPGIDRVKIL